MSGKIRVLVVDDSAVARRVIADGLAQDPRIEVIGTARDAYEARDRIVQLEPQVITLDVEMPRMDGIEFLRRLQALHPVRTIVVSSLTERGSQMALDALAAGAIDVVAKPTRNLSGGTAAMLAELRMQVILAAGARLQPPRPAPRPATSSTVPPVAAKVARAAPAGSRALASTTHKLVAIGASTGGTEALRTVLDDLAPTCPGVVIVQHMPPGFTGPFAARLNISSRLEVSEAKDGDRIYPGRALVAPAGKQLEVVRSGGDFLARVRDGAKVSGHCPSVDVLFHSVAASAGKNAVGLLLTGMGADGADGLLAMRKGGARTFAQDEATSVVWGMPRVAWERGAAEELLPLGACAARVMSAAGT